MYFPGDNAGVGYNFQRPQDMNCPCDVCHCGKPRRKKKRNQRQSPETYEAPRFEPCVHRYFKTDPVERECLTREQYIDMLATPKTHPWLGETDHNNYESNGKKLKKNKHKRGREDESAKQEIRCMDFSFAEEFINDTWDVMSPDVTDRLIDFLVNEFGMTVEEAEDFIDCKSSVGKPTPCVKKQSKAIISLGPKHKWVKKFSEVFANRIEQYIVSMLMDRKSPRVKRVAERILHDMCEITGDKTSMQYPKTKREKTMVLIATRVAFWVDDIMKDLDKPRKERPPVSEEEESEVEEEPEEKGEREGEEEEDREKAPPEKERPKEKEAEEARKKVEEEEPQLGEQPQADEEAPTEEEKPPVEEVVEEEEEKPAEEQPVEEKPTEEVKPAEEEEPPAEDEPPAEEEKQEEVEQPAAVDVVKEQEPPEEETVQEVPAEVTTEEEKPAEMEEEKPVEEVQEETVEEQVPVEEEKEEGAEVEEEKPAEEEKADEEVKAPEEEEEIPAEEKVEPEEAVEEEEIKKEEIPEYKEPEKYIPAPSPKKSIVIPRKPAIPAFEVRAKTGSTLQVQKLSSGTVVEKTAQARGVPVPPRRKVPASESPLNLKSAEEWVDWASNIANMADEWGNWLESRFTDAEKQLTEKRERSDWKAFMDKAQIEALKWRVEEERIKDEGEMWGKKLDKKSKDQPERIVKTTDLS